MKKQFLFFAASLMLLSCSGGLEVKEIEFHPESEIKDASAIKVVNISAPSLMETGALSGKITCSAEIEIVNDLGEVNFAIFKLALLDKNGAEIITLQPATESKYDKGYELAELFKTPGKKSLAFESEEGLSPMNINKYIDQTEAVQIKGMYLKSNKKEEDLSKQIKELSSQINNLLKDNKLDEAADLLTNSGFMEESLSKSQIQEKYDPIYFKVIKGYVNSGNIDAAEELAVSLKSMTDFYWTDCSSYKYLKSEYEKIGRDFSLLSRY